MNTEVQVFCSCLPVKVRIKSAVVCWLGVYDISAMDVFGPLIAWSWLGEMKTDTCLWWGMVWPGVVGEGLLVA